MRLSIPAPVAQAIDSTKRYLSLSRKLAQPAAFGFLLGGWIGRHKIPKLGDCSQPGISDSVATALYQLWIERYDRRPPVDSRQRRPVARVLDAAGITILIRQHGARPDALAASIASIERQSTPNWRLCLLADRRSAESDGSLPAIATGDRRCRWLRLDRGDRILLAEAIDTDAFGWLEPGDELAPTALADLTAALGREPEDLLVYSDEDRVDRRGLRYAPRFKPDWNPELQQATDYVGDLAVCRCRAALAAGQDSIGPGYAHWRELLQRTIETLSASSIRHLPQVLYHRRTAVEPADRGSPRHSGNLPTPAPLVTLIVPTHNRRELLERCVGTLLTHTEYSPFELLIVDHDSDEPAACDLLSTLAEKPGTEVVRYVGEFNYSDINNFAVQHARGDVLGLLNSDLEFLHPGWLGEMVRLALQPDVGAVGAKLLYPDRTVQHGGILLGGGSADEPVAGHLFHRLPRDHPGYCGRARAVQELSAVTAACMVLRKEVFDRVGGFDAEYLPVAFNDVDLCLRIRQSGLRVLWTPFAEVLHLESASRGSDLVPESRDRFAAEVRLMRARWQESLARDPFYNPNLDPTRCDFALAFPPRIDAGDNDSREARS